MTFLNLNLGNWKKAKQNSVNMSLIYSPILIVLLLNILMVFRRALLPKIDLLSNSPWEIFLNQRRIESDGLSDSSNQHVERSKEDREIIEAYRTLLIEIRGAVE